MCELEILQRRALDIIYPCIDYCDAVEKAATTANYDSVCAKTFTVIMNNKDNRLHKLQTSPHKSAYLLRQRGH